MLDEPTFWKIISQFDWTKTGDDDEVMAPARATLSALPLADIAAFDELLAHKLYALDTREHCRQLYLGELDPDDGDDYVSADDFLYRRCAVVANGRKVYEAALRDPTQVTREVEFESLLYLAQTAHDEASDDEYEGTTSVSWESFSNEAGWAATAATQTGKFTGPNIPPGNRRPT